MNRSHKKLTDQELDQLFRDAYEAESVEPLYVADYWTEMKRMLPSKKMRVFSPWVPFASSVILAILLLLDFPQDPLIEPLNQVVLTEEQPVVDLDIRGVYTQVSSFDEPTLVAPTKKQRTPGQSTKVISSDQPFDLLADETQELPQEVDSETSLAHDNYVNRDDSLSDEEIPVLPIRYLQSFGGAIEDLSLKRKDSPSWYVELGVTGGSSPYLNGSAKRDFVMGATLGGGFSKRLDQVSIGLGVHARLEGFGGLTYKETNFGVDMTREVSVKQLYSVDLPLKIGYHFKRSEISAVFVPGVQLFIYGKERIYQNQQLTREGTYTGKVEHSNSLTMEIGVNYFYQLTTKYSLGLKLQADVLRPLHTDYYLGKTSAIPLNGQIVLRRSF